MLQAIGHILLWIFGIIVGIFVLGCVLFWVIFGDAAVWIVRVVIILLIAKLLWRFITK